MTRMRAQDGYTMVIVMMVLLIGTIVSVAAWTAAEGDVGPARDSVNDKRAYAAAEAGVADYLQKLGSDNEYWLKCTNVPLLPDGSRAPVNQPWNGTGTDPRRWRALPPRRTTAYTIELLPRTGYSTCQQNVDASMFSPDGTIQIRSTGRAGVNVDERKRSIITTLRRNGFLDFLYFTEYETSDPTQKELDTGGLPVKRCAPNQNCGIDDITAWADQTSTCRRYIRDGRANVRYPGSIYYDRQWYSYPLSCGTIQFLGSDVNSGPLHSNDTISICGSPKFGRNRTGATTKPVDRVEYFGFSQTCGGSAGPDNGNNAVLTGPNMPILQLPESNSQLRTVAQTGGLVYSGKTTITLNTNTMTVTTGGRTFTNIALPGNGVIYVRNAQTGTCPRFSVRTPYASGQDACGDVFVSGTYGAGLTIAAERDIVATGNIRGTNNALLGLIANNFVRVQHQVQSYPCNGDTPNASGATGNRTIEAAILSLGHVFTLDNYQCGGPLGDLIVKGAIAQRYRGPVGTHDDGAVQTGYRKAYEYDDRLKYRSPPYFLAPVQSAWRVVRQTEMVPAR